MKLILTKIMEHKLVLIGLVQKEVYVVALILCDLTTYSYNMIRCSSQT